MIIYASHAAIELEKELEKGQKMTAPKGSMFWSCLQEKP
jgi:hypothetical protein